MRTAALIIAMLTLSILDARAADSQQQTQIPDDCPVTRPTEPSFIPPPPHKAIDPGGPMFWYGSDALFTHIYSDGRWRGIKSPTGIRNKSFWYRNDTKWQSERPYELLVTARRIDTERPMVTFPRVTNAIMGEEVAMLLMLELPERGCWAVTGNYKSDSLTFVVWAD